MQRINHAILITLSVLALVLLLGGMGLIHSHTAVQEDGKKTIHLPLLLAHKGDAAKLDRPAVAFDHDQHTTALDQGKKEDCGLCHLLKEKDPRLSGDKTLKVFAFPKTVFDRQDKDTLMVAYHDACVSCHKERAVAGKKSGPRIGLCGLCHSKTKAVKKVTWGWSPIFNYARHAKHVKANEKKCELCHHTYDKKAKKLVYKKNTEKLLPRMPQGPGHQGQHIHAESCSCRMHRLSHEAFRREEEDRPV